MLEILHKKIDKAAKGRKKKEYASSSEEDEDNMRRQYGNRNAVKDSRYIEIGWIHKSHLRSKQVRSRTGGGTRKVCMKKDSTKADIMNEAIRLFFQTVTAKKDALMTLKQTCGTFQKEK